MRFLLAFLLLVAVGCTSTPQVVLDGQEHAVQDMVLAATEVPTLIADEAQATKWEARFKAFALRALTILAYLKDEQIDVAAAHAKLFPPAEDDE
jgi:hypothetical protein